MYLGEGNNMKRLTRQLWMLVMLTISVGGHAAISDDEFNEREKKSVKDTKAAMVWAIEDGIATYYREGGVDGFKNVVYETFGYVGHGPQGSPDVESDGYLAYFWLTSFYSHYHIIDLYRETLPDGIYEFWLVKVFVDHPSSDTARSMFYITRADEVRGRREILHKSDRLIERYEVAPGTVFVFPVDDMDVVSKMDAWRYPESYPDSDLKNLKVVKHWRTGRITVERGDGEQWAYEEDRDGYLMWLAEVTHAYKQAIKAGETYSEAEWEEVYDGLVWHINRSKWPIKEKDWKRYKRRFDKLERLDKTAAKDRFDAKERLNIEWKDKK